MKKFAQMLIVIMFISTNALGTKLNQHEIPGGPYLSREAESVGSPEDKLTCLRITSFKGEESVRISTKKLLSLFELIKIKDCAKKIKQAKDKNYTLPPQPKDPTTLAQGKTGSVMCSSELEKNSTTYSVFFRGIYNVSDAQLCFEGIRILSRAYEEKKKQEENLRNNQKNKNIKNQNMT